MSSIINFRVFFKEVQKRTSLGPGEIWTLVCSLHTTLLYHSSHHLHRHWHSETSLEYQTRENEKMNLNQIWKQIFPSFHFFLFWSARKIFFYFFEIFRDSSERHWQREELKDFGFWAWTCKPIQKLFRHSLSLSLSLQLTHAHAHAHAHPYTYVHMHEHTLPFSFYLSSCNCQLNYRLSLSLFHFRSWRQILPVTKAHQVFRLFKIASQTFSVSNPAP